eukprot:bmy_01164T0
MPWFDGHCPGCVPRICVIPYEVFVIADHDYFSFRPNQPLGAQLTVTLSQHGNESQPQNLQCFFDGAALLRCSWEVRSEVTSSVFFTLFYKSGPSARPSPLQASSCPWGPSRCHSSSGGVIPHVALPPPALACAVILREEECSPVQTEETSSLYVRHCCQIPVPDARNHSQYIVSVRPKEEEKLIKSSDNIQMAPPTLNMTKGRDGYILHWKEGKMNYEHIACIFQVQASPVDFGHSEVSPLTTEDPKDACDSSPEPDMTLVTSDLPTEQPTRPPPELATPSSRPESQASSFDFNGPYLGPPYSRSLPDIVGQQGPLRTGVSRKPQPPGSLKYLFLPAGEQVQLVPLAQAMGPGKARDADLRSSPGTEGSPSLESGADPAPPEPGVMVGGQGPKDSAPPGLPTGSRGPREGTVATGYVTTADLTFTLPIGAPSASQAPPLGLPSDQNPSLCPGLAAGSPGSLAPLKPEFEGYVELPPNTGQFPQSPLASPAPPAASSAVVSPGPPRADVFSVSPTPEGLLVLQQVGDYCFLPGPGSGPLSPQSKPTSPGPCPEIRDLNQVFQVKKPPSQAIPQVPAIQLFKALKQQDYLSLPPWDVSRPGEVC